jgi:hypothetical protein
MLVVVLVAGVLLRADPSAAAPRLAIGDWRAVAGAERALLTDDRYVVTRSRAGIVQALNTTRNVGRDLASPPCDNGPALPRALGDGVLVWECASLVALGGHTLVVDDLVHRRRFVPEGLARLQALERQSADASQFHVVSAGRYWIYLTRRGSHSGDDVLVGLSGGEILYQPGQRDDVAVDPGEPSGTRGLCAGIRRPRGDSELGELAFGSLSYHDPYALSATGGLQRCDGAPPVPGGRPIFALSDGYLGWATGRALRLRPTTGRGTLRRDAPATVHGIALTRRFVYVSTGPATRPRVYRARIAP